MNPALLAARRGSLLSKTLVVAAICSLFLLSAPLVAGIASATAGGPGSLSVGGYTSCVVTSAGGVDCWGYGSYGELGNGSYTEDQTTPTAVVNTSDTGPLSGVTSVSVGDYSACAVLDTGGVDCWGYGEYGELGNGTYDTYDDVPVTVLDSAGTGPLTGVESVSNSYDNTCALLESGGVDCWGYGYYGQLGDDSTLNFDLPQTVLNTSDTGPLTGVASISAGDYASCAVLDTGGVDCWGYGEDGALGNGEVEYGAYYPVAVVNTTDTGLLTGVLSVSTGGYDGGAACAVLDTGGVDCWGYGAFGALGNGANASSDVPVSVLNPAGTAPLTGVESVNTYGSEGTTCAVLDTGGVDCWGYGEDGELGDGAYTKTDLPVAVVNTSDTGPLTGVSQVGVGIDNACAALVAGGVDCWGYGEDGELGDGALANSDVPVAVIGLVPPAPTGLSVVWGGSTVTGTWAQDSGASSFTCTLLYGYNDPTTFSETVATPTCSFTGLAVGTTYGISVVANNGGGASASISAFDTPVQSTLTCVKGKKVKHVTGYLPSCPVGYKVKA